ADHGLVFAQRVRPRDWKPGWVERRNHLVFAIDRVRGGQELARGLAAQHVFASVRSAQAVSRVRLSALELLDLRNAEAEIFFERGGIDPMPLLDRLRADELLEHGAGSLP